MLDSVRRALTLLRRPCITARCRAERKQTEQSDHRREPAALEAEVKKRESASALTVVPILVLSSKVHPVLQQHGADGGQVLLGGQMQRCLPMLGQLVYFGSRQQLQAENAAVKQSRGSTLFQSK